MGNESGGGGLETIRPKFQFPRSLQGWPPSKNHFRGTAEKGLQYVMTTGGSCKLLQATARSDGFNLR
jgi:hypothetical protein